MNDSTTACLACGHEFEADELSAITARPADGDRQFLRCAACGTTNEISAQQRSGFGRQPGVSVLRIVDPEPPEESVFRETVRPGTESLPDDTGEFEDQ
jgi:hypothetical protein